MIGNDVMFSRQIYSGAILLSPRVRRVLCTTFCFNKIAYNYSHLKGLRIPEGRLIIGGGAVFCRKIGFRRKLVIF